MVSTQNIDTLEQVAYIERVIQCNGEYTEHRHLRTGGSYRQGKKMSRVKCCKTVPPQSVNKQ